MTNAGEIIDRHLSICRDLYGVVNAGLPKSTLQQEHIVRLVFDLENTGVTHKRLSPKLAQNPLAVQRSLSANGKYFNVVTVHASVFAGCIEI
jgi:hypothetical protein